MKGEIRTMKKITAMDYKRAARDAVKMTFGFAPALKNIIPMAHLAQREWVNCR